MGWCSWANVFSEELLAEAFGKKPSGKSLAARQASMRVMLGFPNSWVSWVKCKNSRTCVTTLSYCDTKPMGALGVMARPKVNVMSASSELSSKLLPMVVVPSECALTLQAFSELP